MKKQMTFVLLAFVAAGVNFPAVGAARSEIAPYHAEAARSEIAPYHAEAARSEIAPYRVVTRYA